MKTEVASRSPRGCGRPVRSDLDAACAAFSKQLLLLALAMPPLVGCLQYEGLTHEAQANEYLEAVAASLRAGELSRASDILARARARFPEDAGVRATAALLAQMRGRDDEALRELLDLHGGPARGGLTEAEITQRIGDLLFRAGRWRESVQMLLSAPEGSESSLRRALAALATRLPAARPFARAFAAELALLTGEVPSLVVGVGGKERVLVLDTGASFTTFGASLAKDAGIDEPVPAGAAVDGAGQSFPVSVGVVASLRFGDAELGPMPVLVVADDRLGLRDLSGGAKNAAAGVLGQDVLMRFRMTIDAARKSVIFEPPRGLPENESAACVWHDGRLLVPAHAEGRTIWLVLDTGASRSSLTDEGLEALPGGDKRAVDGYAKLFGPGGTHVAVRVVRDLALTIGTVRFASPELPVLARGPRGVFPVHGVLGADVLLRCRLTLDQGRLKLST